MEDFYAIFDPYLLSAENVSRIFVYIFIIWWFKLDRICGLMYIIMVFMFDIDIFKACICFVFAWYLKLIIESKVSSLNKLPGRQLYNPILGSQTVFRSPYIYKNWREDYQNYGTIYRDFQYFAVPWVIISNPKLVKYVLVTNAKNYTRGTTEQPLETVLWIFGKSNLLSICGKKHKNHKSIINKAIKNESLKKLTGTFVDCANRLTDHWKKLIAAENESHITVDIHFDCITNKCRFAEEIQKLIIGQRLLQSFLARCFAVFVNPSLSKIFNTQKLLPGACGTRNYIKKFVSDKSEMMRNSERCISDYLIERKCGSYEDSLANNEIEDELFTLIMAGSDATSLGLTYAIYCLSKFPNWQKKCREEIETIMKDYGEEFSWDKVQQLKIVRSTVVESLRLYTPIPVVARQSIDADYLDGYYIPPKTNLQILFGQMHRLPEYWPDPEEFNPERFLNNDQPINPFDAYAPFCDGAHKCVGYHLAVSQITIVLCILLHQFSFELVSPTTRNLEEFVHGITLTPTTEIMIKVLKI